MTTTPETDDVAARLAELLALAEQEADDNRYYSGGRSLAHHSAVAEYMLGNGTSLLSERATDRATIAGQEAEIERLMHVIDRDRYIVAAGIQRVKAVLRGRAWLADSRGPYAYDDARYQEEFGGALADIDDSLNALAAVAWDKADCTRIEERVIAARAAAHEFLQQLPAPREMVLADLGVPCRCTSFEAAAVDESEQAATIAALNARVAKLEGFLLAIADDNCMDPWGCARQALAGEAG